MKDKITPVLVYVFIFLFLFPLGRRFTNQKIRHHDVSFCYCSCIALINPQMVNGYVAVIENLIKGTVERLDVIVRSMYSHSCSKNEEEE